MKTTYIIIEAAAPANGRPSSVSKTMNSANKPLHRIDKPLHRIDLRQRFYNRQLSTAGVLDLLYYEAPRLWELAEVVGKWVWIEFDELPPQNITAKLSELGFHWNRRRQLWQHPCGTITPISNRDPRHKYHAYFPADLQAA